MKRRVEEVSFVSDGLKISGALHLPDGADSGRPAVVKLHGFGGTKDSGGSPRMCDYFASLGYVALRFDFRGCGKSEGERALILCDDAVTDARNALSYLAGRAEVDPNRLALVGQSYGAAVAVAAGSLDERAAAVISIAGWGNGERKFRRQHAGLEAWSKFETMMAEGRRRRDLGERLMVPRYDIVPIPEHLRGNMANDGHHMDFPWEVAESIWNFRAEDVVSRLAPRPLLLIHAARDSVTPASESIELFLRSGEPAELHVLEEIDHFALSDEAPRLTSLVQGWLARYFPAHLTETV
jgi:pimeloyl-ACP methyl ester carboxylesterase